jgi:hypothetical protein
MTFKNFVRCCSTLQAIDELVRLATKGAQSIYTTSVLDTFVLKPLPPHVLLTDTYCLNTVEQILTIM